MNELGNVTILLCEYKSLVREGEKIAAVKRLVNSGEYVTIQDILAVLDIEREKRNGEL